jgi:Arc/MetJ-type ribon-helix-helix transcriptional regulator
VKLKKKARILIAIDQSLLAWVDQTVKKGVFANRSHAMHTVSVKLNEEASK